MKEGLKPSFKNLTDISYGQPSKEQHRLLQELTRPHIESFNYLLHEGLTKIVENLNPCEFALPNNDRVSLSIQEIVIGTPRVHEKATNPRTVKVYPVECRGRATTYKGPLHIQLGYSVNGMEGPVLTRCLGDIPIMVKSDVCNLSGLRPKQLIRHGEEEEEMGGYFIVHGIEKLIRMLIMPRRNFPLCMNRPSWKSRGSLYTEYGVSIRCVMADQTCSTMVLHYLNNGTAVLNFTYNKEMFFVPLIIVLKGLVSVSDKYIYDQLIRGHEEDSFYKGCMIAMLRQALNEDLFTKDSVMKYIGSRFRVKLRVPPWYTDQEVGAFLFRNCIAVHLQTDLDKFNLLVYMTQKLFDYAKGRCASESSDNPMFQEVLLGGHLIQMFLKERLEGFLFNVRMMIERQARGYKAGSDQFRLTPEALVLAAKSSGELGKSFTYLISTGNLISPSGLGLMQSTGLCVVADKLNFLRYVSHFRCIHRGAFFTTMRTTQVRRLLPEAWGFLCPVHTPDGTPCGLLNHLTALCQIQTVMYHLPQLLKVLYSIGVTPMTSDLPVPSDSYTVVLDGKVVGHVRSELAQQVEQKLRFMKVQGLNKIPPTLEVCLVKRTEYASQYPGLFIFTTPARMVRPVINLGLNKVEMIGTFEQVYMDICITQTEAHPGVTTHQEVDDCSILSFVSSMTPFSDFNQSPRNMYQCQMGKQTMGFPVHALKHRNDNKLYKLQTPQTPMVRPVKYDQYGVDSYPLGTNAIVAVISYTGYDMEDAMVINKSSFERGFAHASVYKSELIDLAHISKDYSNNPLMFACNKEHEAFMKGSLELDGLPSIGTLLEKGSFYYSYLNVQSGEYKYVQYKNMEPAYVEQIRVCSNDTGTSRLSKVYIMLRINRNPIIGDKFASRHGQKGVCSMMYPVENLPFTESGMTPDIIFNPHGYPSRMTIGMMIESMAGKSAASYGHCYDATPFQFSEDDSAIDHFGNMLVKAGYNYYGTERFYSGTDGRELEADIFMGVVYYQRLRHMVSDKYQVRTTGPVDTLTQQPVHGRKRQGGVRFGEMERDALISHGSAFLVQDRLFNCSDRSAVVVCTKCGSLLSSYKPKQANSLAAMSQSLRRDWACLLCKEQKHMQVVSIPYVLRYLIAELAAMNIRMDLSIKSC